MNENNEEEKIRNLAAISFWAVIAMTAYGVYFIVSGIIHNGKNSLEATFIIMIFLIIILNFFLKTDDISEKSQTKIEKIFNFFITLFMFIFFVPPFIVGISTLLVLIVNIILNISIEILSHIGFIGKIIVVSMMSSISVLFAYLLFTLRVTYRCLYGKLEIMFGIVAIINSIYDKVVVLIISLSNAIVNGSEVNVIILQFIAGLYIIVRGLDNIKEGARMDRITIKFLSNMLMADLKNILLMKKAFMY